MKNEKYLGIKMTLQKEVCKHCQVENGEVWDYRQDDLWENVGRVLCSQGYVFSDIQSKPPHFCPYDLEHVVSQDVE